MSEKFVLTHEIKMYVGSIRGYNGTEFNEDELCFEIKEFQKNIDDLNLVSLRVTPTKYIVRDYVEKGWEITAINYPRFPKSYLKTYLFMEGLAKRLLKNLKQNRISMVCSDKTYMFESKDFEENPCLK